MSSAPATSPSAHPTPLRAVYAFTFVNSLGTGVITGALFFLAKSSYHFSTAQNFLLGVVQGITYIIAASTAGRVVAALQRKGIAARTILLGVMVALAALCLVPWAAKASGHGGAWSIWLIAATYMPLTGILWPMTESYLSGGRSGAGLRRALSVWNVIWSSAIPITYAIMALFMREREGGGTLAAEGIAAMGGAHVVSAAVLMMWFARFPAPHIEEHHEPHPEVYERLLMSFRLLLPTSYLVASALTPYLPDIMNSLHVPKEYHTVAATAWLLPRVVVFALLGFWGSWHGRWWPTVAGAASLLAGFALCVIAPMLAGGSGGGAGLACLFAGLALFGMGMGTIYSGAIYYALEVGKAGVDAGGTHEALIGVGYFVGPGCGYLAALAVERKYMAESSLNPAILIGVGVISIAVCALVVRRAVRHSGA